MSSFTQDGQDSQDGDTQEPSGETDGSEEFVEASRLQEIRVVDVRLAPTPADSVNTTSGVTLENLSAQDQTVDVRFVTNDEVVETREVVVPADERLNATHSEVVGKPGTHEVAANLATEENGETVRIFDFTTGTVELGGSGEEVAGSSAGPPSGSDQVDAAEDQQSDDSGTNLPLVLLGAVAVIAAVSGTLYWQRHSE